MLSGQVAPTQQHPGSYQQDHMDSGTSSITDRKNMINMVSVPHVPSPTGQNQIGGREQMTDNTHNGLLCC